MGEAVKRKPGRPPLPLEYRELLKDHQETVDGLIDANQFIEDYGLTEEWEEFKAKRESERIRKGKGK